MKSLYQRFDIQVDLDAVQQRFVNRVKNLILEDFLLRVTAADLQYRSRVERLVVSAVGARFDPFARRLGDYPLDFHSTLQAIEAFFEHMPHKRDELSALVADCIDRSETDLGIRWQDGRFYPKGAKELDEALVNESLRWLRRQNYTSVVQPFEKGLRHLLQAQRDPELLGDVVTDMHEALEAMAKKVTGRDADLSKNRELFIKKAGASESYKSFLKEYIKYANLFRHAPGEKRKRPPVREKEVESFVYMTGVFIRLAMD